MGLQNIFVEIVLRHPLTTHEFGFIKTATMVLPADGSPRSLLTIIHFLEHHYYICLLTVLLSALMANGLFNVYFRQLHHIPGPALGGFTDFYKLYIFACKHIPSATLQLHQEFGLLNICDHDAPANRFEGPILRLAPNLVSFNDPQWIPEIYLKCVDKTSFYTPAAMGEYPSMFWTLKHEEHARKKRLFAPSVSCNARILSKPRRHSSLCFADYV